MHIFTCLYMGFPGNSDGKESACNAGDPGSIPGLERSPREGNGSLLQYSCLENSTDKRPCQFTVHEVTKSRIQLRDFHFIYICIYMCVYVYICMCVCVYILVV